MKCSGQIISKGIAYGKARFLTSKDIKIGITYNGDQTKIFVESVKKVSKDIEQKILDSKNIYDNRIAEIFESHLYIVNDPILIQETTKFIDAGKTAYEAYSKAVENVLKTFAKIDNEYMLGRIVDIIDATDQVKSVMIGKTKTVIDFAEDTILILRNLKPSIIYSLPEHEIKGFISDAGFYTQHSGIIAREIHIPGMVCPGIFERLSEGDFVIVDSIDGNIVINPDESTIQEYKRRLSHEL